RAVKRPRALEGEEIVLHVLGRARIEGRPAGGAARAPVLDDLGARRDAELVVEALRWNLAQRFLRQHRNATPSLRLVHAAEVQARQAPLPERRLHRALDGEALSLAVDAVYIGLRARPGEVMVVHRTLPSRSSSP